VFKLPEDLKNQETREAKKNRRTVKGCADGERANPPTSIVECREQLKLVGLAFIMIDEERRLVRCDQLPDFFH